MKGKIFVSLLLGAIGAIYAFLVYPLLKSSEFRDQSSEKSISDVRHLEGSGAESRDLLDIGDSSTRSEGQTSDIQKAKPVASNQQLEADTICFDDICFTIEIADTPALRAQGLMNRESLPQDAGMLFVFDMPGSYGFWMKNTLIPLDIIRLDENFVVVDTATMTPCITDPCPTYNHDGEAMYALEINEGLVKKFSISVGDSGDLNQ